LREILSNVLKILGTRSIDTNEQLVILNEYVKKHKMINDDAIWKIIFNYDGLRRRRVFEHMVDTDGVGLVFHFSCTLKEKQNTPKKQNKTKGRVIGLDPGRSNIIYAEDSDTGDTYRLTRKQWYRESGMTKHFERRSKRNVSMWHVHDAMSKASYRSPRQHDLHMYQQTIIRHYNKLWEFGLQKIHKKEKFRVHSLRQKCLDRFFTRFGDDPIIAYGAANIHPTGKGEMSVPIKHVYNRCCSRFRTEKVDEYLTTVIHSKCGNRTRSVVERSRGSVRGLRWCSTCRELVSRDRNACKNIIDIYISDKRPKYLCRVSNPVVSRNVSHRIHKRDGRQAAVTTGNSITESLIGK
jgi:hypothetical protein